jgi:hypothetical protein
MLHSGQQYPKEEGMLLMRTNCILNMGCRKAMGKEFLRHLVGLLPVCPPEPSADVACDSVIELGIYHLN